MSAVNVLLNYCTLTEELLVTTKNAYTQSYELLISYILSISDDQLSWSNFIQPLIDHDNSNIDLTFLQMKDFSSDIKIRQLCASLETEIDKWSIEQSMRKDLYLKYKYYWNNQYQTEKETLTEEQQSYLTDIMTGYKIGGMELSDDKFDNLKEIKKTISELCSDFSLNLGNENYVENISRDQFTGLPEKFIQERQNEDGTLKITLKYPDIIPIMEYASNRDLRNKISVLFKSRCMQENTPLVEQVL